MKVSSDYILKKIGKEYSLIPIKGEGVYLDSILNLNETGAYIYNNIKQGKTSFETATELSKEYDAKYEDILHDVSEFIELLLEKGIVYED